MATLHPLKKNGYFLQSQIATARQSRDLIVCILDAMLGVQEDEKIPAGLRQVGRSAISEIRASVVADFDSVSAKLEQLHAKCEANLHLPETGTETDIIDASITGQAIAQMSLIANYGALLLKALEHLPKLNKQAAGALVSKITAALAPAPTAS
jgi:hypothetical protein